MHSPTCKQSHKQSRLMSNDILAIDRDLKTTDVMERDTANQLVTDTGEQHSEINNTNDTKQSQSVCRQDV